MATVLLATDADWLFDEVDAALADETTTVHRVRAGRMVLPAVKELDPDLVVLDLQIGNLGGVATSLALRQEEDMGRLEPRKVVMLLDRQADVFMAQMARADGWLVKPVNSVRLRRAARTVLAGEDYFEGMLEPAR
ncbi:MAG: response regulator transcription factor [Acidimicrobiales bacterium]|nr:response regulator transcription factor [Acidimicrobiales bacterium]